MERSGRLSVENRSARQVLCGDAFAGKDNLHVRDTNLGLIDYDFRSVIGGIGESHRPRAFAGAAMLDPTVSHGVNYCREQERDDKMFGWMV